MDDSSTATLPRTVTIREAVRLTGLTDKAIRRRIERGQLQHLRRDGRVQVSTADLQRQGLITPQGEPTRDIAAASSMPGAPQGETVVRELLDRLLAQERELSEVRLLNTQADAATAAERRAREEVEAALHQTRAALVQAEAQLAAAQQRRGWWPWSRKNPAATSAEEPAASLGQLLSGEG